MTGKTISHYQIGEKLGEGGMGVVYKARDTSLDRYVALKLLPADKLASPERKQRFIQEAKAASALNHPHIVTIYEISQEDGNDFISMEYVAGKTLDALIPRNGMRLGEALKYAVQIADALAAAHAAGIVHRDIKPSNIIVGDDGRVRVLDFGLAKLAEQSHHASPEAPTVTAAQAGPVTGEGTVLGTPNYMSPEQAQGLTIDARSDIFSFGAVLYEMLTGRRAFQGDSPVTTMAAIVQEEPEPLPIDLPLELRKVVERCLRKDPERRLGEMRAVRITLEDLKEESDSGKLEPVSLASPTKQKSGLVWLALAAVAALAVVGWLLRRTSEVPDADSVSVAVPLTTYPGREFHPTFSPEGDRVAFVWEGENRANWDIYIKLIGESSLQRLTDAPGDDYSPAWSPDGRRIAFVRDESLFLVPAIGGAEQELVDQICRGLGIRDTISRYVGWHPDGQRLIVSRRVDPAKPCQLELVDAESGEAKPLIIPPTGIRGDTDPAVSPDGRFLAFRRYLVNWGYAVHVADFNDSAEPSATRKLTGELSALTPAWTADSSEVIFSANRRLWRVPASGGAPRPLVNVPVGAYPAITREGNRLAFVRSTFDVDIWRANLPDGSEMRPLVDSTYTDALPVYSPDGTKLAFSSRRTGTAEIWVADRDGSNPVQRTDFGVILTSNPSWSPDGTQLAFDSLVGLQREIFTMRSSGGKPIQVTDHLAQDAHPSWSRDGRWIYFSSNRTGEHRIWKIPSSGGEAIPVTNEGAVYAFESTDGQALYLQNRRRVWAVPMSGSSRTELLDSVYNQFAIAEGGLYFTNPEGLHKYSFQDQRVLRLFELPNRPYYGLSISPDGGTILFTQQMPEESDLMLVENFR